ncbi:MAG: thiamine pyrophosphate-binding protein [SAR324 cluster bacterium]|nr:thiamine pyrophosphate-binding protein [SAR324 cluster bacterium]
MDGGSFVASALKAHGVSFLFTLCGGHISPILVGCKKLGIQVVDVRHEVHAVFAADAVSRMTGIPGVAAVTAGPGVSNTITAVKNAQLAQSPLILLGGASATVLRGRGSLQDIDQLSLIAPHVKWAASVKYVRDIVPVLEHAFKVAQEGIPGPVFVELPIDLLYPESVIREWYGIKGNEQAGGNLTGKVINWYLQLHTRRMFAGVDSVEEPGTLPFHKPHAINMMVDTAIQYVKKSKKPVMVIGSQALIDSRNVHELVTAVKALGIPVFLSGMARGLLGAADPIQFRHNRKQALKQADLIILAGVPCDFRLDYGNHLNRKATLISINRNPQELKKNRRPTLAVLGDSMQFLKELAHGVQAEPDAAWIALLKANEQKREDEIAQQARAVTEKVNPLVLFKKLDQMLADDSVIIADGGDFVGTAAYILRPRKPLSWLDPGVFGTLGVGGGFVAGASLCRPKAQIWLILGDGSAGYSLSEFDTFVRHGMSPIAIVGNDACWSQIARDQTEILNDDVGTVLRHTDYHVVAQGFGAEGLLLDDPEKIDSILSQAVDLSRQGKPVLINAVIARSDFRKGSISV